MIETIEVTPDEKGLLKIARDVIIRGHGEVVLKIRDGKMQTIDEIIKHRF